MILEGGIEVHVNVGKRLNRLSVKQVESNNMLYLQSCGM